MDSPSSAACQNEFLKTYFALRDLAGPYEQPSELLRACLGKDADNFEQQRQNAQNNEDYYGIKSLLGCGNFSESYTAQQQAAERYAAHQQERYLWPRMTFMTRAKSLFFTKT